MPLTVAFQGERGAYSEQAVLSYFGPDVIALPSKSMRDVFEAIKNKDAQAGMVPVENSLAGSINETYDLLLSYDFQIFGEAIIPVDHCLLALPGVEIEQVKRVYSHPQALAQCQGFIANLGMEAVAVYDTAGSARLLTEEGMRDAAAIASRRAAEIYGLKILASGIQDNPGNRTRFYAIGTEEGRRGAVNKTVLTLATLHRPGTLYECLGVFARRNLNLLKLESRPMKDKPWEYMFYLDVQAHAKDPDFQEALEELTRYTTMLRVLGSFESARDVSIGA